MLQLSTCQAFGFDFKDLVSMIQDPEHHIISPRS
uniref:Uncharacterized protein n=1 Tax=Brassica campestris TaxID=3711 RepID=A0A3P6DGV7_BRACM|nr:unnamed protein product [Brassica rapa]